MRQIYSPNPYMDRDGEMILSICKYVPSIIALTPIGTEKYHKINEGYNKVNDAKILVKSIHDSAFKQASRL